jgi:hypothetical protein
MIAEWEAEVKGIPETKILNTVDTGSHRGKSRGLPFSGFHILAQDSVHHGLVSAAVLAEERQNVGIDAKGDLLLGSGP